jgi:hypothetical protein
MIWGQSIPQEDWVMTPSIRRSFLALAALPVALPVLAHEVICNPSEGQNEDQADFDRMGPAPSKPEAAKESTAITPAVGPRA